MSTPLFFPVPRYVAHLPPSVAYRPLRYWCEVAGVRCKASGAWIDRPVQVRAGACAIVAEASPGNRVSISGPSRGGRVSLARYALGALAYTLMDGVARESLRGEDWARPSAPVGRPRTGRARNSRERQRLLRASTKKR